MYPPKNRTEDSEEVIDTPIETSEIPDGKE
jgi:hypothetical protein